MAIRSHRPVRVLTFTTLFPSVVRPRHGIFVESRLRNLIATCDVQARVVAPVPWFPLKSKLFGSYGRIARTPREEERGGIVVLHPRYFVLPKFGMLMQPKSLASAAASVIDTMMDDGYDFDAIDAHFFYPDGVAAAILAKRFQKPFVVTARGSDINLFARLPGARELILRAAEEASRIISVSEALKKSMIEVGIEPERICVLRNGVDLILFQPIARDDARRKLGLPPGRIVASVGNLVPEKGHEFAIRAIAELSGVFGLVVGEGPEKSQLVRLVETLGIAHRIRFMNNVRQADLAQIYNAVDALALGSTREGWPNVLLEAMACGTPVVATNVGGVPEVIGSPNVGRVVGRREVALFADALREILGLDLDRGRIRRYAEGYGWEPISHAQFDIFREVIANGPWEKNVGKYDS